MTPKVTKTKITGSTSNAQEPNSIHPDPSDQPKLDLKRLFYPLAILDGFFKGYSLNLMDEVSLFTLLLKKVPLLKGFTLINWFVSQVLTAGVHTVLKIKLLSNIKKMKRAYYTGMGVVLAIELSLACVAIYFNSYQLAPRLAVFYSSRYCCYLFYIATKIIQNIVEFIHGTVIGRILDYLMLKVSEFTEEGDVETDHIKISENKLLFLTRRERYSIGARVFCSLLCMWARPGYIYYLLTKEDITADLIKRLIVMGLLNVSSLALVFRIHESDLAVNTATRAQTQCFFKSMYGSLKLVYGGLSDCFKKLTPSTKTNTRILRVRTILFLMMSFGHTLFGSIILEQLKSLRVNGVNWTNTDLYYQMSYNSLIQVSAVTLLVMVSQELEAIWVRKLYKREQYHESVVKVFTSSVAVLGLSLFFDLMSPDRIYLLYNILNFSTRVVNLKILLKKETTLATQDALNIWGDVFDAVTLLIPMALDHFKFSVSIYMITSAFALGLYVSALRLFFYYNRICEPLDILSQLGYVQEEPTKNQSKPNKDHSTPKSSAKLKHKTK